VALFFCAPHLACSPHKPFLYRDAIPHTQGYGADYRIVPTNTAPAIDGSIDTEWNSADSRTIGNVIVGSVANAADLSGTFRTLWDATNLYVLVEVSDDAQQNDSGTSTWHDDSVEIYIDANNDKPASYCSGRLARFFEAFSAAGAGPAGLCRARAAPAAPWPL
jgi:Carbohydrate family 9 binding domain-like